MAKLKNPLFSLDARNTLGKLITYVKRRGQNIAEAKPIPKDASSSNQLAWRTMYQLCTDLWHTLSATEKAEWESAARPRHMTGYAWYLSQCLRPNPGIYLPLLGGTMQGDIDMDSNKITGLVDPTQPHHAARKAYVDAATPDIGEGHINILAFNYSAINAGAWATTSRALQPLGFDLLNTTHADLDEIDFLAYLAAATYTLRVLTETNVSDGIVDIDIDGVEVASHDLYTPGLSWGVFKTTTGIVIANSGLKVITWRCHGKNAASNNHYLPITSLTFWRTS